MYAVPADTVNPLYRRIVLDTPAASQISEMPLLALLDPTRICVMADDPPIASSTSVSVAPRAVWYSNRHPRVLAPVENATVVDSSASSTPSLSTAHCPSVICASA